MASKTPKFRPVANPTMHAAMVGKRTSSAAGTHAQGPARERSRAASKRAAIKRDVS
jgi:hypothetical protein